MQRTPRPPEKEWRGTKIYEIITYSPDCGADEKPEHRTLSQAIRAAREYLSNPYYEGVIIYNLRTNKIVRVYGFFPPNSRPLEGEYLQIRITI